jgi:hypothetical protein
MNTNLSTLREDVVTQENKCLSEQPGFQMLNHYLS